MAFLKVHVFFYGQTKARQPRCTARPAPATHRTDVNAPPSPPALQGVLSGRYRGATVSICGPALGLRGVSDLPQLVQFGGSNSRILSRAAQLWSRRLWRSLSGAAGAEQAAETVGWRGPRLRAEPQRQDCWLPGDGRVCAHRLAGSCGSVFSAFRVHGWFQLRELSNVTLTGHPQNVYRKAGC